MCYSVAKTRPGYVQIIEMGDYLKAKHSAVIHVNSQSFVSLPSSVSGVQFYVSVTAVVFIVPEQ